MSGLSASQNGSGPWGQTNQRENWLVLLHPSIHPSIHPSRFSSVALISVEAQKTTKNRPRKRPKIDQDRPKIPLLKTKKRPKIDPKSTKVDKKTTKNRPRSIKITHERPKVAPRCAQEAPKGEKATKSVEIGTHFGTEIGPKTAQDPQRATKNTKEPPRSKLLHFSCIFSRFLSIFRRFSVDFRSIFRWFFL